MFVIFLKERFPFALYRRSHLSSHHYRSVFINDHQSREYCGILAGSWQRLKASYTRENVVIGLYYIVVRLIAGNPLGYISARRRDGADFDAAETMSSHHVIREWETGSP